MCVPVVVIAFLRVAQLPKTFLLIAPCESGGRGDVRAPCPLIKAGTVTLSLGKSTASIVHESPRLLFWVGLDSF